MHQTSSMQILSLAVILCLSVHLSSSAPRPDLSLLSALRANTGSDWGLNPQAFKDNLKVHNNQVHKSMSAHNPYIAFLMRDEIFVQHLQLFLNRPDAKHFNELRNRVRTLSRRRSDEASTRFFLRD